MSSPAVFHRRANFRSQDAGTINADGTLEIIASTDEPCDMGSWTERLVHTPEAIDLSSCRALLINHDSDQIAGRITDLKVEAGQLVCRCALLADAVLQSGVKVIDAIKAGALRGISIGYTYRNADCQIDEQARSIQVNTWRLLEVSATPIPADAAAGVRAFPLITKDQPVSDTPKPAPAAIDNSETVRAEQRQIAQLARSHGLEPEAYVGQALPVAIDAMLADKAKRAADLPKQAAVVITRDAGDTANEVASNSIAAIHGIAVEGDKFERGFSVLEIARRHAERMNVPGVKDWGKAELASYVLGKAVPGARNAPNVVNAFFSTYVLANAIDKAVQNGYAGFGSKTTWRRWCSRKTVSSFKQFTVGGLDSGNLAATLEGLALPELVKADAGYNGTIGLYGATVSLSYQALINDDLGEFMRLIQRAGAIAERTQEVAAFAAISGGTWTNNTDATTPLSTASNLDLVRASFEGKTGPAGAKMGNSPAFLLAPSALRGYALAATKQIQGSTSPVSNSDIEPIITPYLPTVTTKANSKYYLCADPAMADTVTMAELQGAEQPQTMEFDAGAAVARNWRIIKPFVAVLASTTIGGTIYIPGMQQGGT